MMSVVITRSIASGPRVRVVQAHPKYETEFLALAHESRDLHGEWVTAPSTPVSFRAYVARVGTSDLSTDHAGFFLLSERRLVGVVNINHIIRAALESGFIGYYAFSGGEGRGLMTEGLGLVVDYAFSELGLHRLEANIQPANERSKALVQRVGFRYEGFSPKYLRIGRDWKDHERWAVLAEERTARGIGDS
jgi:[ribosomal protein S5]-alanine N-acetyltransferase